MGVDIHMYITYKGETIADDIFTGRNSEWFDNLSEGWNTQYNEYRHLIIHGGFAKDAPKELEERFSDTGTFYGHRHIRVGDFMAWVEKYHPGLDAGWFSTYDRWRIERKGWVPDYIKHELEEGDNPLDYEFVEVEDKYDCSVWLYNYILKENIPYDAYINYCFDC